MQLLVARLDLDDEIDAGGAVELADDDPLGTVDDELAAADHDGHVTQVDRFLEGGLALVEPEPDMERPAVGQAELTALVGVVARLAQVVVEILELERLVVTLDRENLAEDPFQPGVAALVDRQVGLEEPLVASRLDLRQIRNGKIIGDPAEVAFLGRDNSPHGSRCGHVIALLIGRRECKRAAVVRVPGPLLHAEIPRRRQSRWSNSGAGQDEISVGKSKAACLAPPAQFEGSPGPRKPPRPPARADWVTAWSNVGGHSAAGNQPWPWSLHERPAELVTGPAGSTRSCRRSFDLDSRARVFELFLELLGVFLGEAGLDFLGSGFHQVFGLFESQGRGRADDLDDLDLVGADRLEHDVELGLGRRSSLGGSTAAAAPAGATATAAASRPWASFRYFVSCSTSRTFRLTSESPKVLMLSANAVDSAVDIAKKSFPGKT